MQIGVTLLGSGYMKVARIGSNCEQRARIEPRFSLTTSGIHQLWALVDDDRLDEHERLSLSLTLAELQGNRALVRRAAG